MGPFDQLDPASKQMLLMSLGGRLMQAAPYMSNQHPWAGMGGAMMGTLDDLTQIRNAAAQSKLQKMQMEQTQLALENARMDRDEKSRNRQEMMEIYDKYIGGRSLGEPTQQIQGDAYLPGMAYQETQPNPEIARKQLYDLALRQTMLGGAPEKAAALMQDDMTAKIGGPFADKSESERLMNMVYGYQQKKAANIPTTPAEDYQYKLAEHQLQNKPQYVGGPETGWQAIYPPALPTMNQQTAPNIGQSAPPQQAQPQVPQGQPGLVVPPMKTKDLTEGEAKSVDYSLKALEASTALESSNYNSTGIIGFFDKKLSESDWTNWMATEDGQAFYNDGRAFVAAVLRKESGAQVTKDEWEKFSPLYIPMPGDKPEVIKRKAARRATAIEALKSGAGIEGEKRIDTSSKRLGIVPGVTSGVRKYNPATGRLE